jgi:hypothetical protein
VEEFCDFAVRLFGEDRHLFEAVPTAKQVQDIDTNEPRGDGSEIMSSKSRFNR